MVSAFISIYGFVTLTDAEMNELNAIWAANNLPPIQMATRVTNQEVDGAFGDVDALWFSYHLFDLSMLTIHQKYKQDMIHLIY